MLHTNQIGRGVSWFALISPDCPGKADACRAVIGANRGRLLNV
jgi:hypothetical protein